MEDLIIQERETKKKITELINNSGLPAFVLKPIFKDMYEQLDKLSQAQYEEALKLEQDKNKEKKEA